MNNLQKSESYYRNHFEGVPKLTIIQIASE